MADEIPHPSPNFTYVVQGITDDSAEDTASLRLDPTTKRLKVDALIDLTGVTDGEAIDASDKGTLALGTDGTNYQVVSVDSNGDLQIDVKTMPTTTVQATNLDIRDLTSASDSVEVKTAAGVALNLDASGDVQADIKTIAAGTNYIGKVRLTDGTTDTDVRDLANSNALNVAIVDGSGDQITLFGGGTQYTEGDIDATITGNAIMWEDASDTLRAVSASKPLPVDITDTSIAVTQSGTWDEVGINDSGNNISVDWAGTVPPIGAGTEAAALRVTVATDSTGVLSVDDNGASLTVDNAGLTALNGAISGTEVQVDVVGALPAGTNAIGKLAANSGVDIGDVDVTSVIPGTGATNLGKAIDTATGATDTGVLTLATRDDALGALTPIEGDNVQLRVDANGALWTHDDALDAALSGSELQVDVVAALPAGTNAIGKLAANSGVDIGDVDVTSVPAPLSTSGGGTEATALRVTVASDSTGVLSVDDNGGALTVDNGGTFVVQENGSALTALQLIDDVVYVDDADWTGDTSKHVLVGGVYESAPQSITDGDVGPLEVNKLGSLRVAFPEDDLATASTTHVKKYYTSAGAVTDGIIWSPAAGKRWYVTDLIINVSAAATVTLEDDLAGGDSAVMKFELAANSGIAHSFNTPFFSGEDAADLIITTSAGNVYVTVTGYEI